VTEQDLRYSLSRYQDFKAISFDCMMQSNFEDERREKEQEVDLQLGSNECRAYQSVILEPKVQCQLDHMRQLHVPYKNEDGHDRSWECIKVLKYSKERTADFDIDHRCLIEWNDLNNSQSWVNFFAFCLQKASLIQTSGSCPFFKEDSLNCLSNLTVAGAQTGSNLFLSFSQELSALPSG
jgi:hypothetical protein